MCPKVKYNQAAKAVRKGKRMIMGYKQKYGSYHSVPTDIVPKTEPVLPDKDCPIIVRYMTRSELAAIPRDRYEVRVIKVRVPKLETGEDGEEELLVAITDSVHLTKNLKALRMKLRTRLRNHGGGNPPPSNPFKDPIDQYKMADCIIKVMDGFFHDEDKCTIFDKDYNKKEFCVMMHIFFKKIQFLKKDSRLQFSQFVQNDVFAGKSGFIRTFNTYADKDIYKAFEEQLDIKKCNFKNRPVPIPPEKKSSDYHQRMMQDMGLAFQEIGWAFQKSSYFIELKNLKETLNNFVLQ